eukprot:4009786-Pleurochrysis_carterae.AAC.1
MLNPPFNHSEAPGTLQSLTTTVPESEAVSKASRSSSPGSTVRAVSLVVADAAETTEPPSSFSGLRTKGMSNGS